MSGKILIVDDSEVMANLVDMVLTKDQYQTKVVDNGLAAIQAAKSWRPDLILLDVMMPNVDGIEVCRRLRQIEDTALTPIIMVTARTGIDDKLVGFEAGADDYITKPFDNADLRMRVGARLRRMRAMVHNDHSTLARVVAVPLVLAKHRSGMFNRGYRITKRAFDLFACLLAAPLVIPLLLLIALAVRLDTPGPIVFTQKRTGLNGKLFKMYKFRTMLKDAEALKAQYMHLNELTWPDFKITDDPRVTRVGRFLRKTSLDELPQLWNIVIGEMSIVGPRPTSFGADTYELWQTERLEVAPGLTGLWQIKGRSNVDFVERVEMDIEYIERQSWRLDIEILIKTISAVLLRRGAY